MPAVFVSRKRRGGDESLGVAVFKAETNFRAASDRIPGGFGPFNSRVFRHGQASIWFRLSNPIATEECCISVLDSSMRVRALKIERSDIGEDSSRRSVLVSFYGRITEFKSGVEREPGYWGQLQFPLGSRIGPGPHWRESRLGSELKSSKPEVSKSRPVMPKFKPGPSRVKPRKPKPPQSSARPNRSGKKEKSAPPKEVP